MVKQRPASRRFQELALKLSFGTCVCALLLLTFYAPAPTPQLEHGGGMLDVDEFNDRAGPQAHRKTHFFDKRTRQFRREAAERVSDVRLEEELDFFMNGEPHLAGQGDDVRDRVADRFRQAGLKVEIEQFEVLLNDPVDHEVLMFDANGESVGQLDLAEPQSIIDPVTARNDSVPTFHGYSANGTAEGQLVYAHYCRREDFAYLKLAGVDVAGKVVLCRYGGIFRGLKVKFAAEAGGVGALLYTDSFEDTPVDARPSVPYPLGTMRNPDSVQRGSVLDLPLQPGDPSTPGYASVPGAPRAAEMPSLPSIPSIPISFNDGERLLGLIGESGVRNPEWHGDAHRGAFFTGPSAGRVRMTNVQEYGVRPIYNVLGRIQGQTDEEEVVVGNHRDAWTIGAADPNSGTTALLEVAHVLGELLLDGWVPRRSITLASWDAEEYGLVGSTEHGEARADDIRERVVAYLNCDLAVAGNQLEVAAHPLLASVVNHAVSSVRLARHGLSDFWSHHIAPLGSGSDYTVFQDHLGVPSLDIGFARGPGDAVHHYHSNFDTFQWMRRFGDRGFHKHVAITQTLLLATLEVADSELVPFSLPTFARILQSDIANATDQYNGTSASVHHAIAALKNDAAAFVKRARAYFKLARQFKRELDELRSSRGGLFKHIRIRILEHRIQRANRQIAKLDQCFLHDEGLDNRPWFRHVLYAPGRYTGYEGQILPGIAESIEDNDEAALERWIGIVRRNINSAINGLPLPSN